MKRKTFQLFLSLLLTATFLVSCVDENYTSSSSDLLAFSTQRLMMDTTFGTTSTWRLIVYNNHKKALRISSVGLLRGAQSSFRINVDGKVVPSGATLHDVTVKGNDSIYVMVEATNPSSQPSQTPFVVTDSIVFQLNGVTQHVGLQLVCRSANILRAYQLSGDETLTPGIPYLVYDYIYVPQGNVLTIKAGTELYMHAGANIIVDGTLDIEGEVGDNVLIRGDRFDDVSDNGHLIPYLCIPGQWGGVYLQNAQAAHTIKGARIIGMASGVILFGASRSHPSLSLSDSRIHCSSGYGVYAQMADVSVRNCEISNCGLSCLLVVGGTTLVQQSTLVNHYTFASRDYPAVQVVGFVDNNGRRVAYAVDRFVVENSIISGGMTQELAMVYDSTLSSAFNIYVANTLIKGKEKNPQFFHSCQYADSRTDIFVRTKADYSKDPYEYFDFHLSEGSVAHGMADASVSALYPVALDGNARDFSSIGAY
ncbi:MAG: hypothetical protein MJ002_02695 [Paludibacteraceae bacterium]|nr:hypothetical protein [Paludibacteraceae bacterium]